MNIFNTYLKFIKPGFAMLTLLKSWLFSNFNFNFLATSSGLVLNVEDKTKAALVDKSPNFLSFGTSTTIFSNKFHSLKQYYYLLIK